MEIYIKKPMLYIFQHPFLAVGIWLIVFATPGLTHAQAELSNINSPGLTIKALELQPPTEPRFGLSYPGIHAIEFIADEGHAVKLTSVRIESMHNIHPSTTGEHLNGYLHLDRLANRSFKIIILSEDGSAGFTYKCIYEYELNGDDVNLSYTFAQPSTAPFVVKYIHKQPLFPDIDFSGLEKELELPITEVAAKDLSYAAGLDRLLQEAFPDMLPDPNDVHFEKLNPRYAITNANMDRMLASFAEWEILREMEKKVEQDVAKAKEKQINTLRKLKTTYNNIAKLQKKQDEEAARQRELAKRQREQQEAEQSNRQGIALVGALIAGVAGHNAGIEGENLGELAGSVFNDINSGSTQNTQAFLNKIEQEALTKSEQQLHELSTFYNEQIKKNQSGHQTSGDMSFIEAMIGSNQTGRYQNNSASSLAVDSGFSNGPGSGNFELTCLSPATGMCGEYIFTSQKELNQVKAGCEKVLTGGCPDKQNAAACKHPNDEGRGSVITYTYGLDREKANEICSSNGGSPL